MVFIIFKEELFIMSKLNVNNIVFTSVDTVDVFTPMFGSYKYTCDEITSFVVNNGQTNTDIVGGNGAIINTLKRNPNATISWTAGVVDANIMADEHGTEVVNGAVTIGWNDTIKIASNKAELSFIPVDNPLMIKVGDIEYTVGKAAEKGKTVTYTQGSKTTKASITFAEGEYTDGTEVHVKYDRQILTSYVDRVSDKVSEKIAIRVTGQWEDACNTVRKWEFDVYTLDLTGEYETNISDSQTNQTFEGKALKTRCGGSKILTRWKFFDENEEDYTTA